MNRDQAEVLLLTAAGQNPRRRVKGTVRCDGYLLDWTEGRAEAGVARFAIIDRDTLLEHVASHLDGPAVSGVQAQPDGELR